MLLIKMVTNRELPALRELQALCGRETVQQNKNKNALPPAAVSVVREKRRTPQEASREI